MDPNFKKEAIFSTIGTPTPPGAGYLALFAAADNSLQYINAAGVVTNLGQVRPLVSVVSANSATTWNYQGTDVKALTSNWQNTYATVSANSATWAAAAAGADTEVRALTSNWQSSYTALTSTSANWNETRSVVQSNSASWGGLTQPQILTRVFFGA